MKTRADNKRSVEQLLSEVDWLERLPSQWRDAVYANVYDTSHAKGDFVVRMGEPASSWIGVAEGLLKISAVDRGGRIIMFTGVPRGSWIGEGAVIKREPRRYDIVALRECRLLHLPSSTFRWLMDSSIEFAHVIVSHLNERLSQFIETVEINRIEEPSARVAKMLAVLYNPVLYQRMSTALPMSQSELGELVGLSRSSISGALKQLEREGLITTQYGGIVLNNVAGLRSYESSGATRTE